MVQKCEDCPDLIKRYGYCQIVGDWVCEPIVTFSWEIHPKPKGL